MKKRKTKGIWIPIQVWDSEDLSLVEKALMVEIRSLDNSEGCFASNGYFAKHFQLSKGRISQLITSLTKKGYIETQMIWDSKQKQVKKRIIKMTPKYYNDFELPEDIEASKKTKGVVNKLKGGSYKIDRGYLENAQDNNTLNNTKITSSKKTKKGEELEEIKKLITEANLNDKVVDTVHEFIEMRKEIKKPMTPRALKMMLNKLVSMERLPSRQVTILQNSIIGGYQGIFPLKDNNKWEKPKADTLYTKQIEKY